MIRIRSKKTGFRRCGLVHSTQWTEYPDERFTEEELARLRAEPMLQVEAVEDSSVPADELPRDPGENLPPGTGDPAVELEPETPRETLDIRPKNAPGKGRKK